MRKVRDDDAGKGRSGCRIFGLKDGRDIDDGRS